MSDNRRNQEGGPGKRSDNPLNAVTDMLAAAWGTAVGIGCAVLGIKRSGSGQERKSAAGPQPERPEAEPQQSAKVAPIRKEVGRSATTGAKTTRSGARQTASAKQGTAAKQPGGADKGATQRPATNRGRAAAKSSGARAGTARQVPRPKASEKHPAPPRPGEAARAEAPASSGPPAMAPVKAEPQKPSALDGPRGGKADDLKQITGIGPKLEEKLNGLGIYHYSQIAGWSDGDIARIDAELQAKGRVERDNWVGQAAALMSGAKPSSGGEGSAA
jgi:predicted flap endonuclease-1-like 5' DNA nuclease